MAKKIEEPIEEVIEETVEEEIVQEETPVAEPTYTINVGDFVQGETTYSNRCLSASFGGSGVSSNVIPWADTEKNPWDYKYEDGEFVLDVIEIPTVIAPPTEMEQLRADVDYLLMIGE